MLFLRNSLNQIVLKHNQSETEGAKFKHRIFLDVSFTYQLDKSSGHICVPLESCQDNGMQLKKNKINSVIKNGTDLVT